MAFRYPVRVYFSDTDAGGIVYHARYLDFAEHARTELLRTIASEEAIQNRLLSDRIGFVVKALSIEYHLPAYLDDLLEVENERLNRQSAFPSHSYSKYIVVPN